MSRKNQISFTKPAEPAFLKQFKERAGFKEGPTVEDKKRELPVDDGNQEDRPDERPQIISVKPGDLTEEEVDAIVGLQTPLVPDQLNLNLKKKLDDAPVAESEFLDKTDIAEEEQKMVFRKPGKRMSREDEDKDALSTNICKDNNSAKKQKQGSVMDKISNKSLLSFDHED